MRALCKRLIVEAGVKAGLGVGFMDDKPLEAKPQLEPPPRMDVETLTEDLNRTPRLFAVLKDQTDPAYAFMRYLVYQAVMAMRAEIQTRSAEQLEELAKAFVLALPKYTADDGSNIVQVKAQRIEHSGFERKLQRVFPVYYGAVYLNFEGGLYRDERVPYIRDFDLVSHAKYRRDIRRI